MVEMIRMFLYIEDTKMYLFGEKEEDDFAKVKEFLWDKVSSSVDAVHEKTGVSKERIIQFIRQGRILAAGLEVEILLACERCGQSIAEGQYCKECRDQLIKSLTEEEVKRIERPEERHRMGKMYITKRLK